MHYAFTSEFPPTKIDEIVNYLLGPRLWIPTSDYPDFEDWAERTHGELRGGYKRALIALRGPNVVGAVIYQRHKQHSDALEIKNITVRPDEQGRYIASFLLRNAEVEGAADFNSDYAVCDAKANNVPIRLFLNKLGYLARGRADLYGLNAGEDLIYEKKLRGFGRLPALGNAGSKVSS